MSTEQRVIQPFAVMAPPVDPVIEDAEAERFEQDLTVPSYSSFQEWVQANRAQQPVDVPATLSGDVPEP